MSTAQTAWQGFWRRSCEPPGRDTKWSSVAVEARGVEPTDRQSDTVCEISDASQKAIWEISHWAGSWWISKLKTGQSSGPVTAFFVAFDGDKRDLAADSQNGTNSLSRNGRVRWRRRVLPPRHGPRYRGDPERYFSEVTITTTGLLLCKDNNDGLLRATWTPALHTLVPDQVLVIYHIM